MEWKKLDGKKIIRKSEKEEEKRKERIERGGREREDREAIPCFSI